MVATCAIAVVSDKVLHAHRAHPQVYSMADAPMLITGLLTMLLALVTISYLLSGLLESVSRFRRSGPEAEPGAAPNGGPAMRPGNSGACGGPPSVS